MKYLSNVCVATKSRQVEFKNATHMHSSSGSGSGSSSSTKYVILLRVNCYYYIHTAVFGSKQYSRLLCIDYVAIFRLPRPFFYLFFFERNIGASLRKKPSQQSAHSYGYDQKAWLYM